MKVLIFILIVISCCLVLNGIYLVLFLLFILLAFNLLKLHINYDPRIELSIELYNNFKICCEYHRYMQNSGIYDDNLDSNKMYKAWEKEVKIIELTLPKYLLDEMGAFPMREFEARYKQN